MNKKTECALVQNLLPNHLEGLTSDETNEFIERHLKQCEDCHQLKRILQRPLNPEEQAKADLIEYLRRDRIRRRRRWIFALIALPLIAIVLLLPFPRRIDHTIPATLWTSGQPDAGSQVTQVRVQGTYYDYLVKHDRFEGTIVSPDMEIFPENAAINVKLDDSGLITAVDSEHFLRTRGFMYADGGMKDFFLGLYGEENRWTGSEGRVLTASASDREEAVAKTRKLVERLRFTWLKDGMWEGNPSYNEE